ncbi:hypothetical protein G9A89_003142 [Geosiphon pyriformis]|nr:hypothetical protein G9A89_003142 [Geosiphon pyriformis]
MIFKKSSFYKHHNHSFHHKQLSPYSLTTLPNEVLLLIFHNLDFATLLSLCNVSIRLNYLSNIIIAENFKDPNFRLLLGFDQENKWKFNVDFTFSHVVTFKDVDEKKDGIDIKKRIGNLVFKPTNEKTSLRVFNSTLLRNPCINRVSLVECKKNSRLITGSRNKLRQLSNNQILYNTEKNSDSKSYYRQSFLNFFQKSYNLPVKTSGTFIKERNVYRVGHSSKHLPVQFRFIYKVKESSPSTPKLRSGERWITPVSFECPSSFFYPHEPTAHKILWNLKQGVIGTVDAQKYSIKKRFQIKGSNHTSISISDHNKLSKGCQLQEKEWNGNGNGKANKEQKSGKDQRKFNFMLIRKPK